MLTRRKFLMGAGSFLLALELVTCTWHDPGAGKDDTPDETGTADHPGASLYSVRYYRGGGENGDSDAIELTRDGDTVVAVWEHRESWGDEGDVKTERLDESSFDELARIASEYDLLAASERPDSEIQALDAPTTSITYTYLGADGAMDADSMFTVSDTQDLTDQQWEGFRAACDALLALAA